MNKINDNDHSLHGNIPFSWENRPGVRKDNQKKLEGDLSKERWTTKVVHDKDYFSVVKEEKSRPSLPPPPCENSNKVISNDIGLPLPPCVFQPYLKSSSRRSKDDDPFLLAYKECTKSTNKKIGTNFMRMNSFRGRSCKYSCSVRDDSIVRVSQIPMSNSDGKRFQGIKHQG